MKRYFLFLNLLFMLCAGWSWSAFANKRYRYIKREHGVRFQGNIPISFGTVPAPTAHIKGVMAGIDDSGFTTVPAPTAHIKGAYTYNLKGMFEAGAYFEVMFGILPPSLAGWSAGLLGEYNIIKNRGKRKFIPSVGISLGVDGSKGFNMSAGVHSALKIFVGKRTPFIVNLGYKLMAPPNMGFMQSLSHNIDLSMGFAYYFDFY